MEVFVTLAILIMIAVFYLLPTLIASQRDTNHQGTIFFINLLFGWTILGWIAALIWAVVEQPKVAPLPAPAATPATAPRAAPSPDKPWAEPFYK